jgi:hypothetical protein
VFYEEFLGLPLVSTFEIDEERALHTLESGAAEILVMKIRHLNPGRRRGAGSRQQGPPVMMQRMASSAHAGLCS